jgi:hypothetical protein
MAASNEQSSPMAGYVDMLLRSDNQPAQDQQNPSEHVFSIEIIQ